MKHFLFLTISILCLQLNAQNVGVGTTSPEGKVHILNNAGNSNVGEPTLKIQNNRSGNEVRTVLKVDNNAGGTGEKKTVEIKTIGTSATSDVIGLKSFVSSGTTDINYSIWGQLTGDGAAIYGESTDDSGLAARFDGVSYLNGKVGVKTDNPLTNLHIHDNDASLTTLTLTPMAGGLVGGDSTALFFGEDEVGNRGMLYLYDGDNDELKLFGKNYNVLDGGTFVGPHQSVNRSTGEYKVHGNSTFTQQVTVRDEASLNGMTFMSDDVFAGAQSTSIILNNQFDQPSIRMYGNANMHSGFMELRFAGERTIKLDGATNNGGEILLYGPNKHVEIQSNSTVTKGGRIRLFNKAGSARLVMDSEYGTDGLARIICDEIEIRGGADLTEAFDINSDVVPEPGMLVCVDESSMGDLTVCSEAYDTKVIGVLSGANGIRPGMRMSQEGSIADGDYPIAVTGRVFVKANAQNGAIRPGDFLTTSDENGEAMKAGKQDKTRGAIIGKSLSSIVDGFVLILISLQ